MARYSLDLSIEADTPMEAAAELIRILLTCDSEALVDGGYLVRDADDDEEGE